MHEHVKPIASVFLNMEEDLKQEFETRLAETGTRFEFWGQTPNSISTDNSVSVPRSWPQILAKATGWPWTVRGNAYLTGETSSTNFPTINPFQDTNGGYDAFIAKIATLKKRTGQITSQ
jgi:hypothetical protein